LEQYIYELYFSVTGDKVLEEKLTVIKSYSEHVLYERSEENGIKIYGNDDKSHLDFISQSTRTNQLFLTNTVNNNNNTYMDAYNWFKEGLKLISTSARFVGFDKLLEKNQNSYEEINSLLNRLDTGISHLDYEIVKDMGKERLREMLENKESFHLTDYITGERYIEPEGDEKAIKKLVTYHKCDDKGEYKFEMWQESDGTKRLIELLPAFLQYEEGDCGVFIIDEFDRSIHHLLLARLLERYLTMCNKDTRLQLIFTTHDLLLMDQELLRRDEMFVVERDDSGVSSVIPLNEYKNIRSDKDLLKSYIQGRFGGIPRL